ncbi:hypothetical protein SPAR_00030 [Streptomyces sparsogenes DSM 40356]|uniref:Uncharacterized protein n=1 Tax=Streptomyces sparsogenes DSM 40356 TaxID=1331668 RepID=A0A1R1STL1_9ACTN|nr:hypothetical protein SPAR_00030 [Streptomyces sparsogenes DSM 40356]
MRTNASRRSYGSRASSWDRATPSSKPVSGSPRREARSAAVCQSSVSDSRGLAALWRSRSTTARRAIDSSQVRAEDLPWKRGRPRSARR